MDLIGFVFGRPPTDRPGPRLPRIKAASPDAEWREAHVRKGRTVSARLAERDGVLETERGPQSYRAGEHFLVTHGPKDRAVVRRDVFERTYTKIAGDDRYEKRDDIRYRYFILPRAAIIVTPEGPERADAGDWIIEDVNGGLYPVSPDNAKRGYQPA